MVVLHEAHEQEDPHLHELPQHWFGLVDVEVEVEVWLEVLLAPHIFAIKCKYNSGLITIKVVVVVYNESRDRQKEVVIYILSH